MIQLISFWLSCFTVTMICFLPIILLHIFFVYKGVSVQTSVFAQKFLSASMIIVPFVLLAFLVSKEISPQELYSRSFSISTVVEKQLLQAGSEIRANSSNISSQKEMTLIDIWFPFVGLISFSSFLGLLFFISRILLQELKLRSWATDVSQVTKFGIRIFRTTMIEVPFSIGILHKRIFLPSSLEGEELEVIRTHEINHCILNHHAWSLLEAFQTHVFWFNPLAHLLRKSGNVLREIECDERSTQSIERLTYSKVLINTAEKFALKGMMPIRGQGWNHTGGLRMRLNNLLEGGKAKSAFLWTSIFAIAAIFSVSGTFYFAARLDSATEASILQDIGAQYGQVQHSQENINIEKVPAHFIKALLIHEDQAFLEHDGVSMKAVVRATGRNIVSKVAGGSGMIEGGSTLTQQLAKQFLSDQEKSISRKFREYKVAKVLESHFSKNQILEMYLNMVYFGNQTTGLAKASQYYFHTSYNELNAEQSAMLIPFLEAPTKFNMLANPEVA